jgi:hypothetical protein
MNADELKLKSTRVAKSLTRSEADRAGLDGLRDRRYTVILAMKGSPWSDEGWMT